MISPIFLFLFYFSLVSADCEFIQPKPLDSTYQPQIITCNTTFQLEWVHQTTSGSTIRANLYENYIVYVGQLFFENSTVLNGSKEVFLDCNYDYTTKYSILLDNDGSICETIPLLINPCGNNIIDLNSAYYEECDRSEGCNEWCRCGEGYIPILNSNQDPAGCCGSECQFDEIYIFNDTNLKGRNISVNNDLIIGNQTEIIIDSDTSIQVGCFKFDGFLVIDTQNQNNFTVIVSKCPFNLTRYNFTNTSPGCSSPQTQTRQSGLNYIFEVVWTSSPSGCNSSPAGSNTSKASHWWLWVVFAVIFVIIVVLILLASFHPGCKKKIFPWRKKPDDWD